MKDLREFIEGIRSIGELKVIEGADWDLEIGNITHIIAEGMNPPAILYDNVKDYSEGYRILAIPFTTENRLAMAFGLQLGATRLELVKELRAKLHETFEPVPPVEINEGPISQNILMGDDVDLFKFPTPKWHPLDGGRYIGTGTAVITRDPDEGYVNVGTHRVQIHDKRTATIFMDTGKHTDFIRKKYWARRQSCPVVVTCGGDPFHIAIGGLRIPWGTSEFDYMGWLKKEAIEVIKGPTTGLPIPAHSEIALEGEMISPDIETKMEGPFAEWTSHYTDPKPEAVFKVNSILYRNNPIILAVLPFLGYGVGTYPLYLIRSAQVWNELDRIVPGIQGVWSHVEFGGAGHTVISIKQMYGGHAKQAALAALPLLLYMQKLIIVVDDDVDPSNLRQVLFSLRTRTEPSEWDIIKGYWGSRLNPVLSPEKRAVGDFTHSTAIILACKPYHWIDRFPPSLALDPEIREKVKAKWSL